MLARAEEELLTRLIDYAGLFPPASLSMDEAVRNYDSYRRGPYAWMLNRFIVPAAQAREVPLDFPLSVLGNAPWEVIETKEIVEPNGRTVYVETTDLALIPELARRGLRAKIRTGGVTPDAFPSVDFIAQFIRACRDHHVIFKATAGLHHPRRCVKPLTYAANAPTGTMHGFLNVFIAAAIPDRAEEVLMSNDFSIDGNAIRWRDVRLTRDDIATMRRIGATSFGSCSFEEPIADLKEMGWL
jgi:hypothetical protein